MLWTGTGVLFGAIKCHRSRDNTQPEARDSNVRGGRRMLVGNLGEGGMPQAHVEAP